MSTQLLSTSDGFSYLVVLFFITGCSQASTAPSAAGTPSPLPLLLSGQSNAFQVTPFLRDAYAPTPVESVADGGVPIADWDPIGPLWARLLPVLPRAYAAFVWWQGESDWESTHYLQDLRNLIARVRDGARQSTLPVVVVRVLPYPELERVRADQAAFVASDVNARLISTDDFLRPGPQNLHLTEEGYRAVARRIVDTIAARR